MIVVLAARRLRSRQFERENNEFETMSLMRRIKCGLQNIQYNNEILNLSNSNWLAENLRKAIHEQTGKYSFHLDIYGFSMINFREKL